MFKGTKFLLLTVIAVFAVIFVSCGEGAGDKTDYSETDSIIDGTDEDTAHSKVKTRVGIPSGRQNWPALATGQHQCFDNVEMIPCPLPGTPYFGQDGNYQVGTRSYDVNESQGTVEDTVTGLTWQRGHGSGLTWEAARSYCENLSLAGGGWRLPNTHEIKSLVDYGTGSPAINTTAFPDTPSDWFWGSSMRTSGDGFSDKAWIVGFIDGFVEYTAKSNTYNVRCVRID